MNQPPLRPPLNRTIFISLWILCLPLISADWCRGSVTFSNSVSRATGSWPEAVAIGDLNGDGRKDVVMTTSAYASNTNDNSILIFFQNASGGLDAPVRYAAGAAAVSVAIADFNGDGRNDIAVGKKSAGIRVFLQDATGGFTNFTDYPTANANLICAGDFNNDGRTDIAGIGFSSSQVDVFTQTTNGTLAFSAQYTADYAGFNDLKAGDVNGDGLSDIVVMNGQTYGVPNLSVLLQTNGGFAPAVPYSLGGNLLTTGVGIGDVTGDGRNDVVVCYGGNRPNSKISVFDQTAGGVLTLSATNDSYDIPEGIVVADMDMDGRSDVVTLHGGWQRAGVYLQNSSGTLNSELLFPIPYASSYNPHGLAVGDVNGDGKPDIVIADYNNGLVILYNSSPPPPFKISGIKVKPGGQVVLTAPYPGPHGSCIVQRGDSLGNWTTVGTMTDATWTDNDLTASPARFYRLVEQ